MESQIEIAKKLNFLTSEDYQKLISAVIEIGKMINGLIKSLNKSPKSYILNSIFFLIFLYSIFHILYSHSAQAAVLYLEPAEGEYASGDIFAVKIKIDSEGECVNAVDVYLKFSNEVLRAINISDGDSLLSLWIVRPEIDEEEGLIHFTGGIPGGYCGRILGDPGPSDILATVIFNIPGMQVVKSWPDAAEMNFLAESQVLLNDGLGTPAKLSLKGAKFDLSRRPAEISKEEWYRLIQEDDIAPEPFIVHLQQDSRIFDGKYFIVFSTTDKQSGLDHYEVREIKRDEIGKTDDKTGWQVVQGPYVLQDQELDSLIQVKAVDKAGNERVIEVPPSKIVPPPPLIPLTRELILVIALIAVILGAAAWIVLKKVRSGRREARGEK